MQEQEIIVTVVGNSCVGKTCLINTFMGKSFTEDGSDRVCKSIDDYTIRVRDTPGVEEYNRIRSLVYTETNVFIVCFALDDRMSYQSIKTLWYPELQQHQPNAPLLLLGTKLDVANRNISHEEGLKLQKEINAVYYVECSAKEVWNIVDIFDKAVLAYQNFGKREKQRDKCSFL